MPICVASALLAEGSSLKSETLANHVSNVKRSLDGIEQIQTDAYEMGKCQEGSLFPGYSPNVSPGFEPGSLGGHVLAASLTINCCLVLFFSSIRLVKLVSCKLGEQCPAALTIRNLTEDHPWVIGKM